MRSLHTPKEHRESLELQACLSMVACNEKGFALCCIPAITVSEPVTRYLQQDLELKAVTLEKLFTGVIRRRIFYITIHCHPTFLLAFRHYQKRRYVF